jgi:hypothetical protein
MRGLQQNIRSSNQGIHSSGLPGVRQRATGKTGVVAGATRQDCRHPKTCTQPGRQGGAFQQLQEVRTKTVMLYTPVVLTFNRGNAPFSCTEYYKNNNCNNSRYFIFIFNKQYVI